MYIDKNRVIEKATIRGRAFLAERIVAKYLKPFETDDKYEGVVDPVLVWFLNRLANPPEIALILQDWNYIKEGERIDTVEGNVGWVEKSYNKVVADPTLTPLFQTHWSKELIDSGRMFAFNAAWGVRKKIEDEETKSTGPLPSTVHDIAREKLWPWVVSQIKPKNVWIANNSKEWINEDIIKVVRQTLTDVKDWQIVTHPYSYLKWMNKRP